MWVKSPTLCTASSSPYGAFPYAMRHQGALYLILTWAGILNIHIIKSKCYPECDSAKGTASLIVIYQFYLLVRYGDGQRPWLAVKIGWHMGFGCVMNPSLRLQSDASPTHVEGLERRMHYSDGHWQRAALLASQERRRGSHHEAEISLIENSNCGFKKNKIMEIYDEP